jgi:hypothetical protein
MTNAALASDIVSLDEYRRQRGERKTMSPRTPTHAITTVPLAPMAPALWVYWVPVWVW